MELKDQVCDVGCAKKFCELGVKQESVWYWVAHKEYPNDFTLATKGMRDLQKRWYLHNGDLGKVEECNFDDFNSYSAFTVAELYKIIYEEGLSFGLPDRWRPEIIPTYMAAFLMMTLEKR